MCNLVPEDATASREVAVAMSPDKSDVENGMQHMQVEKWGKDTWGYRGRCHRACANPVPTEFLCLCTQQDVWPLSPVPKATMQENKELHGKHQLIMRTHTKK